MRRARRARSPSRPRTARRAARRLTARRARSRCEFAATDAELAALKTLTVDGALARRARHPDVGALRVESARLTSFAGGQGWTVKLKGAPAWLCAR